MGFLFALILIGYVIGKLKAVPDNTAQVLSKLENNVFVPALVLGTFMENFTLAKMTDYGALLICGLIVQIIMIPFAIGVSKALTKDTYIRKIYTYGLCFSNFGFMGNAVVKSIFGDAIFLEYLIFQAANFTH